jgi:AcrR family transcriptional regulator
VLDAAERRFLADGYAGATVAVIAAEAGVSVETVYKAFGGKAGLVRALYERGVEGQGPVPAYQRSDEMRAREQDPWTIMQRWGELTAEVAATVSPIRLLLRAAADADPEMAEVLARGDEERLDRMRHHAQFLADRGYLHDGITVDEAADVLWTCSSLELYETLVLRRGWSLDRFAAFVADFMATALLADRWRDRPSPVSA